MPLTWTSWSGCRDLNPGPLDPQVILTLNAVLTWESAGNCGPELLKLYAAQTYEISRP